MLKKRLNQCLDLILPPACILCDAACKSTINLCQACIADLPYIKQACKTCGLPLSNANLTCGACLINPPIYDRLVTPFYYQHPLNFIVTAIKFHNKLNYAKILGLLLADAVRQRVFNLPEIIIPIPMHRERLKERGYNQALEIARPISRLLDIPIDYQSCARLKSTSPQTGLKTKQRRQNIKNAFHIRRDFTAKHVALVDDVVTTGSTITELCKVLKSYGVKHIQIWGCARTVLT
ncbi:MAG: hypothetical protein K0S11_1324 [Gammaproteobacteria bacterium]|jgi:ComF family protein|nr:hypothetical protein [Gammaproteobacteria bacterium]